MTTVRRAPSKSVARSSSPSVRLIAACSGIILVALLWAFWPSRVSDVKNLDSRGTSVIAFGDSLTAGYGAKPGEDYPAHLSSMAGIPIINAGVSGDTTDSALRRLDRDVVSASPRIVLVGLGGNDYLRGVPITSTEENLRTIVRKIHDAGAMVVILGFRFPSLQVSYEKMYERVASDEKCLLIPDMLDGILSNQNLRSDAIHPNAAGYRVMAERVSRPLKKLVSAADQRR